MDMPVPSTDFSIPDADARGFSVDPNKSHTIPITFLPTAPDAYLGTLEIVPDDAFDPSLTPVYIFLQGQGFATTVSCLTATSDNSLDFGQALVGTTSGPLSLSIVNGSPNALPLVVSSSAPEFKLDRMTVNVAASQKLLLSALFSPDSARKFTGLIKVTYPNSSTPLCAIPAKGEGVVALGHDGGADAGLVLGPTPGCSCTVTAHGSSAPPALPLLVLVALLFRRRARVP
jgi:MYXO-CTERM domain-containing protein